ncbi:MAG: Gfo/Idh/MocA family protein [bacterium]
MYDHSPNRREFAKTAAATALTTGLVRSAHAAGSDVIKVGLIGCGGRGTGAAVQALTADPGVHLTALGDAFKDRLEGCHNTLKNQTELASRVKVTPETSFTGIDCYKKVVDSGVDVVLLAAPPGFRPQHIAYAVEKGKHVFAEKPVATDPSGVRSVMESCKKAREKKLMMVSGLCWRYHNGMRETFKAVKDGGVGEILTMQCNYNTGPLWYRSLKEKNEQKWSDMEWQMRNWLYFTWLSGDHNVEQHIHSLDKMAWAMGDEPPVKAVGLGGRQQRTEADYGNIFDHHAVVYEYANGVRLYSFCRQQAGTANDVSDWIYGTQGVCDVFKHRIEGKAGGKSWRYRKPAGLKDDMYQNEHNELFAALRAGKTIDNSDYMCKSTLMAIMGRMATYSGKAVTWEEVMNSKEDLFPADLKFGDYPVPPVAIPGITTLDKA